ncbi:hypothetical protein OIV19_18225 [Brucella sp. HL-2]|nr:hypothetical protein [Brucella sp. HL-2]MCV9909540.1 hypothetical protein [Brucella sp. HL-2]
MAKDFNTAGLDRRDEVLAPKYRANVLPWHKRVEDVLDDPRKIQLWTYIIAALILLTSFLPLVAELIIAFLGMTLLIFNNYKKRKWRAPYRVPAYANEYLKRKFGRPFLDATQEGKKGGVGEYYLGAEFPDSAGRVQEVWAEANDLKTHRLVIGTTGSGKTEEIMGLFHNSLMLDSGMILVDGKADPKTYKQMLGIARLMGREEDFLILNYLMAGRDPFGPNEAKSSNTYNPLAGGVPSQKAELMISLLSGGSTGKSDIWSNRAEAFLHAIMEPLSFLESRGYVLFSPQLLGNFYLLENIENLFHFGIIIQDNGKPLTLNDPNNPKTFRDWQTLKSRFMGQIGQFLVTLPGYSGARPTKPWPVRALSAKDVADANIKYLKLVSGSALKDKLQKAENDFDAAQAGQSEADRKDAEARLIEARRDIDQAFYAVLGQRIVENEISANDSDFQKKLADVGTRASEDALKFGNSEPEKLGQSRDKVNEQFGYITMQLVRATNDLTFSYGHIYNVDLGEIDFRDVAFNRRILYVTLPALTRSSSSMEQLGKMAVTAIKSLMGEMLNVPFEGVVRKTIDARPSNAHIPLPVVLDEYGYYVTMGFAVAPAQARAYGFSMTFGVQDYNSLLKANREEGEATFENTNLRHIGRTTGGEESDTYKKLSGAAGNAFFFKEGSLSFERGRIGGNFKRDSNISLEVTNRLSYNDLAGQRDGEFTLIVGTKSGGTKSGDVAVVRYTAYYTGNMPTVENMRLMHYAMVKPLPTSEREAALNKIGAERMRREALQRWLSIDPDALYNAIRERLENLSETVDEYSQTTFNDDLVYSKLDGDFASLKSHTSYYQSAINSAASARQATDVARLSDWSHIDTTIMNNRFTAARARLRHQSELDRQDIMNWLRSNSFPNTHISMSEKYLSALSNERVSRDLIREKKIITGTASRAVGSIISDIIMREGT